MGQMNENIAEQVRQNLANDFGLSKASFDGQWLQGGECPECNKRELFTRFDNPWVIKCGHENKCGYEGNVKELYPDAFEGFNKRFKPTATNPNATADAYLQNARGFDISKIKGWYEQGKFWSQADDVATATVRFYLDDKRSIYMERFVEELLVTDIQSGEKKKRKAHFKGSHRGMVWMPPGMVIEEGDTIWIVEAVLDAIALHLNGIKAVATLSCVNYPEQILKDNQGKKISWVWALDNDNAGRKYIRKHVERMKAQGAYDIQAALPPSDKVKLDWNDLHQRSAFSDKDRKNYFYYGNLVLANSAKEKALVTYNHKNWRDFSLEYNRKLYWFNLDLDRYEKALRSLEEGKKDDDGITEMELRDKALEESGSIVEIANCAFTFLYYQANVITDESWYYARVEFAHGARPVKNTFTGSQLSSSSEFKKRLLSIAAGSLFTGTSQQLDKIIQHQLYALKIVQTIDYVGYSKEHGCYVYNDIAVKAGQLYPINSEDFFDMGKLSIKSLAQSVNLSITQQKDKYQTEWVGQLYGSFGPQGMVALAFWLGSLFAEQIRAVHKSYPFIEIIGEPGAGKSTLIEFLWRLVGRNDYEGIDPNKATPAGRARAFAQVSNMPVVLIESDRGEDLSKQKQFDWDELKTAYNGRSLRARGMKNSGNETYEPPFRGAIVVSQNAEVQASEAILQRIVHCKFTRANHNPETKVLAEKLERTSVEDVSNFLLQVLAKEKAIIDIVMKQTPIYEQDLMDMDEIKHVRIAKNHAQMMALAEAMRQVVPMSEEAFTKTLCEIIGMAKARQVAISADHPIVATFWEVYDYLDDSGLTSKPRLNHSKKPDQTIAINLPHFVKVATEHKQQIPAINDLKRYLKSSKSRKFDDIKSVDSLIEERTMKCWVFKTGGKS